jgi:branched-chain amino acid transport system permease protein
LKWQAPFWLGLLAAGLIPTVLTLPIGYVSLKLRGPYFVIVTLAFAEIARMVIKNWVSLTGGPMGLPGIPSGKLSLWGRTIHFTDSTYYYLVLALGLLTFYIVRKLAGSRIGRAWVAIREDEDRALALGINSRIYALQALCWGSFFAGVAGGVYAYYIGLIAPEIVAFYYMITMLVMLILGGAGTAEGPIIGAIIFTVLPEMLRIAEHYRLPILGGILMLAVIFFPAGLRPLLARLPEILKERKIL